MWVCVRVCVCLCVRVRMRALQTLLILVCFPRWCLQGEAVCEKIGCMIQACVCFGCVLWLCELYVLRTHSYASVHILYLFADQYYSLSVPSRSCTLLACMHFCEFTRNFIPAEWTLLTFFVCVCVRALCCRNK